MGQSSRREFLRSAGLLSGAFALAGSGLLPKQAFAGAASFGLPYYKGGAPFLQDLRVAVSESFFLQGVVYQHDGKTPLSNAVVEIWHCDQQGHFDFSQRYLHRGKTLTDSRGRYRIQTNFPGPYKENGHYVMRRVFLLVSAPGYQSSFSQLYFDRNHYPYIDHKNWSACPLGERPSLPKRLTTKQQTIITYHHYLKREGLFRVITAKETAATRLKVFPNQQLKTSYINFGKSTPGHVVVRLYNKKGCLVQKRFFQHVAADQILPIEHNNLPSGLYTCMLYTSRLGDFTRRLIVG